MLLVLLGTALTTSTIGALGGLGGAILLVPVLALAGLPASEAAPLGLVSVAAGSVAAGSVQLRSRAVNHRLGVTTELTATLGAGMGAVASGLVSERALVLALAGVALLAAVAVLRRDTSASAALDDDDPSRIGEWPGQIGGVADVDGARVPYRIHRVPLGLSLMWLSGVIAGVSGASGGFVKTPVISNLMGIPLKVAAATTTFTIGVTAAAGLVVFALQGRIDPQAAAAVIVGSLVGGQIGAVGQSRVPVGVMRAMLGVVLVVIAGLLVAST
jgi:uncharacterized protein